MTEPALTAVDDRHARRRTAALAAILGLSLVAGMTDGAMFANDRSASLLFNLLMNFVILGVGFVWLHYDGIERNFRRSVTFNVAIVLVAIVAVPVYLHRSRPPGKRALPMAGFFALIVISMLLSALGFALTTPDPLF